MTEKWAPEKLAAYQDELLATALDRALLQVPHYARRYGRLRGKTARSILKEIEPVEKATIQAQPDDFIDPTVSSAEWYEASTGGTSGVPLRILLDRRGFQIEWAFMVSQWSRVGFKPGMRRATFRGKNFGRGQLWRSNPVYDEILFSPFAMSEANLPSYIEKIRSYGPDFLYGYPSALTILARFIQGNPGMRPPFLRGLLCGSENLYPGQRELLESTFKARLFSWYGMSEKVILAGECEHSSSYHAFPQYGVTEIQGPSGNVSDSPGATGELVGTGFWNSVMPFIRYKTGDSGTMAGSACAKCGRSYPIIEDVRGRWQQEMLIGRSGASISLTALNMHGPEFLGLERFQLHQRERGRVIVRVVPGVSFDEARAARLLEALRRKTAQDVDWVLERTSSIALSPRGKSVFLVQELGNSFDEVEAAQVGAKR